MVCGGVEETTRRKGNALLKRAMHESRCTQPRYDVQAQSTRRRSTPLAEWHHNHRRMLSASRTRLMASAVAGQWIFGIILALLGQLFGIPAATAHAGLDLDAQARLLLTLFTGQLLFTAIAGRVVDRLGSTRVLAAGSLVMAAAVFLLASAAGFRQAMIAALLMSLGGAAVNAAANTLVSTPLRRPPRADAERARRVRRGRVGIGAAGVQRRHDVCSRCTPGSCCSPARARSRACSTSFSPVPQPPARSPLRRGTTRAALRDPWVLALMLLLIIDFGNEAVMAGWIAPYTLAAVPAGVSDRDGGAVLGCPRRGSSRDAIRAGAYLEARAPGRSLRRPPRRVLRQSARRGHPSRWDWPFCSRVSRLRRWLRRRYLSRETGIRSTRVRCSACCCRSGSSGA